jgi:ribonuclease E
VLPGLNPPRRGKRGLTMLEDILNHTPRGYDEDDIDDDGYDLEDDDELDDDDLDDDFDDDDDLDDDFDDEDDDF